MFLAGDIGGTHTRLAWCEADRGDDRRSSITIEKLEVFQSRDYDHLNDIVQTFVTRDARPADAACFGVAGPVRHGHAKISNLDWEVEAMELGPLLGLETPKVRVVNDLEANAWGIACLSEDDFLVLSEGEPDAEGNQALIAAGTGLGEAGLHREGESYRPIATEGGHSDFAARTETEHALARFLAKEHPHVSYERVLSGPGIANIYRFLRDEGHYEEPTWLGGVLEERDPAATIAKSALEKKAAICIASLDHFVSIYGAEAGNLALKLLATAGVFVGGGIAPKILPALTNGRFLEAFRAKGRMSELLERVPVRVIVNESCALLGAARIAAGVAKDA